MPIIDLERRKYFDLRDYGGVLDDATDDTAAWIAAVAAASAAGGGTVFAPWGAAGVSRITEQVAVPTGVNIECVAGVWVDCGGGSFTGFRFNDWSDSFARNLQVRNIVAGVEEYQGILVIGDCQRFLLENCRGENCSDGGIVVKRHGVTGLKPSDGLLVNCVGSNSTEGSGIEVYRCDRITLRNCHGYGCTSHGIRMVGGTGNRLESPRAGDNTDQQIYLGGAGEDGVNIAETLNDFDVIAPHVYATAAGPITGLSIRDGCRRGRVIGGQIDGRGFIANGLYAINASGVTGTDHGARDVHVTGLTIRGTQYGVRVSGAHRNVTVSDLDIYSGLHATGDNLALLLNDSSLIAKHILLENVRQHYSEGTIVNVKQYSITDNNAGTSVYFRNFKRVVDVSGGAWGANGRAGSLGTLSETGLETIPF